MNCSYLINIYSLLRLENCGRLGGEGCLFHFGLKYTSEPQADKIFCHLLTLRVVDIIIKQRRYYLSNVKDFQY